MGKKIKIACKYILLCVLVLANVFSVQAANSIEKNGKQVVLVLDAGHGGADGGASSYGYQEKRMTLSIILSAKKYFDKDDRFKVYYTRTTDKTVSLQSRYTLANKKNADLYISVHIDSFNRSSSGTSTLYNARYNAKTKKKGHTSKSLATAMQKAVAAATGFPNRGIVDRSDLITLGHMEMPSCMIEFGFISNPKEVKVMNANLSRYGKKLYEAIVKYCYS